MKVFIYWNVHKQCWSIRACEGPDRGRVINHASAFEVRNAKFKVSEAGRQRVIATGRKAVHAGVEGELTEVMYVANHGCMDSPVKPMRRGLHVKYHPYIGPHFIAGPDWQPASGAPLVRGFYDRTVLARDPVWVL